MNTHTIKIYSTPTCPYCIRAKSYLDAKGLSYENIDVAKDKQGLEEMVKISGQMGVSGDPSDDCSGDPTSWERPPDTTVGTDPAWWVNGTFAASAMVIEP